MKFRFKAFGWHVLASVVVLTLVLGGLHAGWYRWPGWYLTDAIKVVPILAGVDVALGPLLTFLIANPRKPRRELARDIALIATVQLVALGYGATTLWHGRPMYYAFSEDRLQLVRASDLDPREIARARQENPALAPHWYSLPRWVWAPLPEKDTDRSAIVQSAISGGDDVIQMPRYFKSWERGLPNLRTQLKAVANQNDIRFYKKQPLLTARMAAQGFATEPATTLIMTGRGQPLLAVFDPVTLKLRALLCADVRPTCLHQPEY